MNKIFLDVAYAIALSSVPSACRNVVEIPLPGPPLAPLNSEGQRSVFNWGSFGKWYWGERTFFEP